MAQVQQEVSPSAVLSNAQNINTAQIQANQPDISTLQSMYNPATNSGNLTDTYNQTLQSILAAGSTSLGQQANITNTQMAQRGILPSSLTGQQALTNADVPITSAIMGANTTAAQNYNAAQQPYVSAIGSLQGGNMTQALTSAQNIANAQAQAGEYNAVMPANISQTQASTAQALAEAQASLNPVVGQGDIISNLTTGQATNPQLTQLKQLGYKVTVGANGQLTIVPINGAPTNPNTTQNPVVTPPTTSNPVTAAQDIQAYGGNAVTGNNNNLFNQVLSTINTGGLGNSINNLFNSGSQNPMTNSF